MATSQSQQVDAQSLPPRAPEEAESVISSLVYDLSLQDHTAMENMLKMINEIDQSSLGIMEEVKKCKDSALERQKSLEDEKEQFLKAAYTVLEMLNSRE